MLTERPVHANVKSLLMSGKSFEYGHLIKFERPSRLGSDSKASTSSERYTYLTDASRNIRFDDGSKDLDGNYNGEQLYLANKVQKVSSVAEQTRAKASSYNLTLDGNGIGAAVAADKVLTKRVSNTEIPQKWDITWPAGVSVLNSGFQEGDKIILDGIMKGAYNLKSFRANNTIRVEEIDDTGESGLGTLNMSLGSEEIKSILLDKTSSNYSSFINREVFIYRAYQSEGKIVDSPFLIFKGIISDVSFDEDDDGIQVQWGLTSHWGDFTQVKGRITSDEFHRALDSNGIPQPSSSLRAAYAYDKGFSHSETSINVLAKYTVMVEKQEVKAKNGFLGIGSKVKVKTHMVPEDRNTELDFQLKAKSLPVVYGVRTMEGIPIFADTKFDDSSVVYTAYALSEGEIGGLYDAYIDDNSLICNNKADYDARSTQTSDDTVDLICRGRADRGDVLSGTGSVDISSPPVNYYANQSYLYTKFNYNYNNVSNYRPYSPPVITNTDTEGRGVVDGESIKLSSPQEIVIDVFSGKSSQRASSQLVEIAQANNFKVQRDYWNDQNSSEYWGPNHRLLDTAYIVVKTVIKEGETSVPDYKFVVRGKAIDCYNYDYSYSHYTKNSSESADNFELTDTVHIYDMTGKLLNSNAQIIDKWSFYNPDGTKNTRFRFDQTPDLNYSEGEPGITKFYIKKPFGSAKWTMVTYNYTEYSGSVSVEANAPIISYSNQQGFLQFDLDDTSHFGPGYGGNSVDSYMPRFNML